VVFLFIPVHFFDLLYFATDIFMYWELMKAMTRECRTKGGKSLIELQIFNGASPIKCIHGTNVCPKKESGNAIGRTTYKAGSINLLGL